jgi:hypothetical protein
MRLSLASGGCLLLRSSSIENMFNWGYFPVRLFSIEVNLHWGFFYWSRLPLRLSSIVIVFHLGHPPLRSFSIRPFSIEVVLNYTFLLYMIDVFSLSQIHSFLILMKYVQTTRLADLVCPVTNHAILSYIMLHCYEFKLFQCYSITILIYFAMLNRRFSKYYLNWRRKN